MIVSVNMSPIGIKYIIMIKEAGYRNMQYLTYRRKNFIATSDDIFKAKLYKRETAKKIINELKKRNDYIGRE